MTWVNAAVHGILLGGLFALFATGLSLAFGVMRFVNLAHGASRSSVPSFPSPPRRPST